MGPRAPPSLRRWNKQASSARGAVSQGEGAEEGPFREGSAPPSYDKVAVLAETLGTLAKTFGDEHPSAKAVRTELDKAKELAGEEYKPPVSETKLARQRTQAEVKAARTVDKTAAQLEEVRNPMRQLSMQESVLEVRLAEEKAKLQATRDEAAAAVAKAAAARVAEEAQAKTRLFEQTKDIERCTKMLEVLLQQNGGNHVIDLKQRRDQLRQLNTDILEEEKDRRRAKTETVTEGPQIYALSSNDGSDSDAEEEMQPKRAKKEAPATPSARSDEELSMRSAGDEVPPLGAVPVAAPAPVGDIGISDPEGGEAGEWKQVVPRGRRPRAESPPLQRPCRSRSVRSGRQPRAPLLE